MRWARSIVTLTVAATGIAAAVLIHGAPAAVARSECASLARVTSFHGTATVTQDASASGTEPTTGGTLAIGIDDGARSTFTLTPKLRAADFTIFAGTLINGGTQIEHTYGLTDSDGTPDGSATDQGEKFGYLHSATLLVSRALCQYTLSVSFSVPASFSGDPGIPNPGGSITIGTLGPRRALPAKLTLTGGGMIPVHETCGATTDPTPPAAGCYSFSGGWATDFETLELCHSPVPVNCAPDDTAMGTASITWHLVPTITLPKRIASK